MCSWTAFLSSTKINFVEENLIQIHKMTNMNAIMSVTSRNGEHVRYGELVTKKAISNEWCKWKMIFFAIEINCIRRANERFGMKLIIIPAKIIYRHWHWHWLNMEQVTSVINTITARTIELKLTDAENTKYNNEKWTLTTQIEITSKLSIFFKFLVLFLCLTSNLALIFQ